MSITLTMSAEKRVSEQLVCNKSLGLRFSVNQSGCSGYAYALDFANEIRENDTVFSQNNVKIIIDKESLSLIDGTQIDYISEGLNHRFIFKNPKATNHCGCGESFAVS